MLKKLPASHLPDRNMGSDQRKRRGGATIVETVIALTIFAVFSTGACKLMVSHRKILDLSRDIYTASNLAKSRLELARTLEFEQVPDLFENQLLLDASGIPSSSGHFRRTTTVSAVSSNLYEVVIQVDIQNRKTLAFSPAKQDISTYVAKHL